MNLNNESGNIAKSGAKVRFIFYNSNGWITDLIIHYLNLKTSECQQFDYLRKSLSSHIMKLKIILFLFAALFIQTVFAQNPEKDMQNTTYGKNTTVGKYADIRGFKMYYETYGQGEPLLIIHGNGGSISNFLYQIPYFSKNYQVIIADSRAQGKSVDHTDSLSYEMMTDDINALLDKLNLKQANVIGWSDGGINGLLLAIHHPDKVKKLAVTGANLWPDTSAVDPFVYNMVLKQN